MLYARIDDRCKHLPEYDGHAVHALVQPDGTPVIAVAVHRDGAGILSPKGTLVRSLGGTRAMQYSSDDEALRDALRLSSAMTKKAAGFELAIAGGKTVVFAHRIPHFLTSWDARVPIWEAYGKTLLSQIGTYLTAEDMNTGPRDMEYIQRFAPGFVAGCSQSADPSPKTALGVLIGIRAALRHHYGDDSISSRSFAVQGVGSVGAGVVLKINK